jgi:hypothetical protein
MAWLTGWNCRKSVILSRSSGSVTDYQMKLLLGESSGSTGYDTDCGGFCISDFSDIRFTTSDGITLLSYWIESISGITPNQTATIWIKFDSIGITDTTFYLYFSFPTASAVSDGIDTFPFFDDFNDGVIDTNIWTNNGDTTESNGLLVSHATATALRGLHGKTYFPTNYALRSKVKSTHFGTDGSHGEMLGFYNDVGDRQVTAYFAFTTGYGGYFVTYPGPTTNAIVGMSAGTWCIIDIKRNAATNVIYSIDDANEKIITNGINNTYNLTPQIETYFSGSEIAVDWLFVRKYYYTDPVWGSWSNIEINTQFPNNHLPFRGRSRFLNYAV